ncbi:MAG: response regulator [Spirochaetaceae bacterium]
MNNSPINILLIEDSPDDVFFIKRELEKLDNTSDTVHISRAKQLKKILESKHSFDIVLTDYNLGSWTGLNVLEEVLFFDPLLPVILVSGRVGEERAVEVIRRGARDYVSKDDLKRLPEVIYREVRNAKSERRELEMAEKLQESEARFEQVFRVSPDPMVITDPEAQYIRDVNKAFCDLTGYSAHDLVGNKLESLDRWTRLEKVLEARQIVALGGTLKNRELSLNDKEGGQHTILWSAEGRSESGSAGVTAAVLWLGKDITTTLQMEKNLRDSERLRSLGTLSGGIAHDFNNILMVMMGYTEMAMAKVEEPRISRYLNEVYQAVQRARELIKQILAFSRGDEGVRREIRPAAVVKEVLKLIRPSIPSYITIRERISAKKYIYGDPSHVHQIVMNLCTNSYHAMKDTPGTLTVSLSDLSSQEGDYVVLEVVDTGKGIDEETLDRIFEPFYTTKAVGEGTGLGLSVVHGLVESYGGSIHVKSREGEGTRVIIYLPAKTAHGRGDENETEAEDNPIGRGHILIVDDEEEVANILSLMAGDLGYSPKVCLSSEAALKEFIRAAEEGKPYDGVVTDLTMPGMTGRQLAEKIKILSPNTPVLLCSGYYESSSEEEVYSYIDDYLSKPIEKKVFAQKITTYIGEKKGDRK